MRLRQKVFAAFAGIALLLTLFRMRRRRSPAAANHDRAARGDKSARHDQSATVSSQDKKVAHPAAHDDRRSAFHRRFNAVPSRPYMWIIASVALSGAALLAASLEPHSDLVAVYVPHPFMPGVLLLAAFVISAFLLRKNVVGNHSHAPLVLCLAILQLCLLVLYTWRGAFYSGGQPGTEIELAAIGLCALGIALAVASTWVGRSAFYEPIAIGLVALLLGAVSVPGLRFFTRSFSYPDVNGSALLFSTGSADQALSLNVTAVPSDEVFKVTNSSAQMLRWALLLTDDARLEMPPTSSTSGVHYRTVPRSAEHPYKHAQLFWGAAGPRSSMMFSGATGSRFVVYTSDRAAESFPEYGEGHYGALDPSTQLMILEKLGRVPTFRRVNFTVYVSSGRLAASDSVSQSTPALTPNAARLNKLKWAGHDDLSVFFALTDQLAVDSTANALFVYAILLGIAGACLIEAIRGIVTAVRERDTPSGGGTVDA